MVRNVLFAPPKLVKKGFLLGFLAIFLKRGVNYSRLQINIIKGQASWAKMTSGRGKLTAPACHVAHKYIKLRN